MHGPTVRGDIETAVDYHKDNKLDFVLSEGDWFEKRAPGFSMLMNSTETSLTSLFGHVKTIPPHKAPLYMKLQSFTPQTYR